MLISISGYEITTLMQALQDADMLWENRIAEAEAGNRPALSVEGARLLQDDLRHMMEQIRLQLPSEPV
jgi:hypothetical protein